MTGTGATRVVPAAAAAVVRLGDAATQHVLLGGARDDGSPLLLGLTVVGPGRTTALIEHDIAEVAYVLAGSGWMVTDVDALPFSAGDAVLIEPRGWHAIRAGEEEVRMVFVFPAPAPPPTRTAEVQP